MDHTWCIALSKSQDRVQRSPSATIRPDQVEAHHGRGLPTWTHLVGSSPGRFASGMRVSSLRPPTPRRPLPHWRELARDFLRQPPVLPFGQHRPPCRRLAIRSSALFAGCSPQHRQRCAFPSSATTASASDHAPATLSIRTQDGRSATPAEAAGMIRDQITAPRRGVRPSLDRLRLGANRTRATIRHVRRITHHRFRDCPIRRRRCIPLRYGLGHRHQLTGPCRIHSTVRGYANTAHRRP